MKTTMSLWQKIYMIPLILFVAIPIVNYSCRKSIKAQIEHDKKKGEYDWQTAELEKLSRRMTEIEIMFFSTILIMALIILLG